MHEVHTPSVFDVAAILITLAAALSWLNHKFLKLPSTVGLALMGAIASLVVLAVDAATPSFLIGEAIREFFAGIDFETALMQGMLSFLLFAGALHVDLSDLKRHALQVGVLSAVGVLISTLIVGFSFYWIAGLAGFNISLIWCLVFGALISPTDPVAVLGAMRAPPRRALHVRARQPKQHTTYRTYVAAEQRRTQAISNCMKAWISHHESSQTRPPT